MGKREGTKKGVILEALADGKPVPVKLMAKKLYHDEGVLGVMRVVNLISAYRAKDPVFKNVRVRNKHICFVTDPRGRD